MRYYKIVTNGYITQIGTGLGGTEIDKDEYDLLLSIQNDCPPQTDYYFKLKEDYTWEEDLNDPIIHQQEVQDEQEDTEDDSILDEILEMIDDE